MKRVIIIVGVASLAAAGLFSGAGAQTSTDSSGIIAGRQAAFDMSAQLFGGLRAVAPDADVKPVAGRAKALGAWARALPGLFPVGSDVGKTTAGPAIWTDRAGFEKAAANYADAVDKLTMAADANDKAAYAAALPAVGAACGACHSVNRAKKPA